MEDLKVLFWNLGGNKQYGYKSLSESQNVIEALECLHKDHHFDVIFLAECNNASVRNEIEGRLGLQQSINTKDSAAHGYPTKIAIFHRPSDSDFDINDEAHESRYAHVTLLIGSKRILLTGVHFTSQKYGTSSSRQYEAHTIRNEIFRYVDDCKTDPSTCIDDIIVIGDFNHDPFTKPMTDKLGFYTTMDINLAAKADIDGIQVERFYNPSWGLQGHLDRVAKGSYRKTSGSNDDISFHMLDQLVFTKGILKYLDFSIENFEIVPEYFYNGDTKTPKKLIKDNGVFESDYSDHLPIRFAFNKKIAKKKLRRK